MSPRNVGLAFLHFTVPLLGLLPAAPAVAQLSASIVNRGNRDVIYSVYGANNAVKTEAIVKAGGVINGIPVQSGDSLGYSLPSGGGAGTGPITENGKTLEIPADDVQYSVINNSASDLLTLSFSFPVAVTKQFPGQNGSLTVKPVYEFAGRQELKVVSNGGHATGLIPRGSTYKIEIKQYNQQNPIQLGGSLTENLNYVHPQVNPANPGQPFPGGVGNPSNVPGTFPPNNVGATNPAQGAQGASLNGVWLKGPPDMTDFEDEIAIVLFLKETEEGLEMRLPENDVATFYSTGQVPRQTYVGKLATMNSQGGKQLDISSFRLQVTSSSTMIQTANDSTYHLRRAPANFSATPKVPLKVDGIWRKLPPGQRNYDPNLGFNVTMKTVPGGVGMTLEGIATAYYANMGTNAYSGVIQRGVQGDDQSPPDIKKWRIFQLAGNRMIQIGTGGTKYYLFKVSDLPDQPAVPQNNLQTGASGQTILNPNLNSTGIPYQTTSSAQVPAETGSNMTPQEAMAMLAVHNQERALVDVAPLKWSPTLAQDAQAWANAIAARGYPGHSDGAGVNFGENWSQGGRFYGVGNGRTDIVETPVEAAQKWAGEKQFYTPGTPVNSGPYLHYTQMVWRGTTEMGCGKAEYTSNGIKYAVYVARYNPPGNRFGANPY